MGKRYNIHLKGYVGGWDFSSDMIEWILNNNKDNEVNVLITSPGGTIDEGMLISALFKNHGNVNVHYIGVNASAATIASMGAKHISMDADALYLVHCCRCLIDECDFFNADEIDKKIKKLDKIADQAKIFDSTVAAMYARRCRKSQQELLDLMKQDRFMTAKEAKEWGFIDEITDQEEDKTPLPESSLLVSAGLPPIPKRQREDILTKLASWLKGVIDYDHKYSTISISKMEKYEKVLSAMGSESISVNDGKSVVSTEQLDKLEAELVRLSKSNAELEDQVKELQKQPGENPNSVIEQPSAPVDEYETVCKNAREMYNAIK